jgi:hypothetical protein
MTAILIDPFGAEITGIDRYLFAHDIQEIVGHPLLRAAVLPHGDVLFVAGGCVSTQGFRLAGLVRIRATALSSAPAGVRRVQGARLRRSCIAEIVVFVRLDEAAEPGADVSEERMSCRAASRSAVLGRR